MGLKFIFARFGQKFYSEAMLRFLIFCHILISIRFEHIGFLTAIASKTSYFLQGGEELSGQGGSLMLLLLVPFVSASMKSLTMAVRRALQYSSST